MHIAIQPSDVEFFDRHGYIHVPGAIRGKELRDVRKVADHFMAISHAPPEDWREDFKYGELVGPETNGGDMLCRVEYPFGKSQELLALAAHPIILELAFHLHGKPSVVTWEDMIVKVPKRGVDVPFHQDVLYQSTKSRVFSIGVYLDDSMDNPLLAFPGTQQRGKLSEEEVAALANARRGQEKVVPAQAGDLIVHNVLMIHGSAKNLSAKPRRVIYFEFRTLEQLEHDSPWGPSWIRKRACYIPAAIETRRRLYPSTENDCPFARQWMEQFGGFLHEAKGTRLDFRAHHDDIEATAGTA